MEEQKSEVKEQPSTADNMASTKSDGNVVKPKPTEESLKDFVVIDELNLVNNKEDNTKKVDEKTTEKEETVDTKSSSDESTGKAAPAVNEADKENKEKGLNGNETEKNGDELILTADDDLEATVSSPKKANPDTAAQETADSKQNTTEMELPNASNTETSETAKNLTEKAITPKNQRVIWVSNISKTIKATDLKQHLSKAGKVITAKIVTDGKRCFGYVLMENSNDASECLKTLNNSSFDGKNIILSFDKPTKGDAKSKTNDSHSDSKKSSKEGSRRPNESDSKRADKRPRSSSKQNAENDKEDTEQKPKAEDASDPSAQPPEKKARSRRSRSRERYLRERLEQDRLKRRLLEEERKAREARIRQIEVEERQREKEFRLDQERRKLQMERELFEKQKKEWARINEERRKLDRARVEVEQQRARLEEDLKKERLKRNVPDIPSVVSKISDPSKKGLKMLKRDDYKSYDGSAPPPPKLGMDFDLGGRKSIERKMGRVGERKMDGMDRKFYDDTADRKKHYSRKPDFDENKTSYMKRYASEREDEHRTQWTAPMSYGSGVGQSTPRYQEPIAAQQFGGASRASGYYYQPSASSHEFSRYDQVSSRKY